MESDVRICPLYYTLSVCQDQDKHRKTAVLTGFVSEVRGKYANVPHAFDHQNCYIPDKT